MCLARSRRSRKLRFSSRSALDKKVLDRSSRFPAASFQTWTIFNVTRITNAKIGDKAPSRGNVQGFVQRVGLQYRHPAHANSFGACREPMDRISQGFRHSRPSRGSVSCSVKTAIFASSIPLSLKRIAALDATSAFARSKRALRVSALGCNTTKRQGSLQPSEGAKRAASTSFCTVPAGRGSV